MRESAQHIYVAAVAAHKAGKLVEAEGGYRSVLKNTPEMTEAHYLLGAVLMKTGRTDEAINSLMMCRNLNPDHVDALNMLGALYSDAGRPAEAVKTLSHAATLTRIDPNIWCNLGRARCEYKQYDQALDAFKNALDLRPDYGEALNGYGLSLAKLGRMNEAVTAFTQCLAINNDLEAAHSNLVQYLIEDGQIENALERCGTAIEKWPDRSRLRLFLAVGLQQSGREEDALASFQKAIELDPLDTLPLNKTSNFLYILGRWKEAEIYAQQSLEIDSKSASALNNLGRIRLMRGDLVGAINLYKDSILKEPDLADAHNNLGNAYLFTDRIEDALVEFDTAIALKPNKRGYLTNRGLSLLTKGEIGEGWKDYRCRFENEEDPIKGRRWPWPYWQDNSLDRKRVLLWAEQGIGDQILFSRFILKVAANTSYIILECSPRLIKLFERSFPGLDFAATTDPPDRRLLDGPFDFHSSVVDVSCSGLRGSDSISELPALIPDPNLTQSLKKKYHGLSGGRPVVGISWRSLGTKHAQFKSTALKDWVDILTNGQVAFVNLQYGDTQEELDDLERETGISIIDDSTIDALGDIDPFAAQIAAMDLVITTSNTTAHLAGALDIPVWNMTPTGLGRIWYWFMEGSESPWYASMKLFRHSYREDWSSVLSKVSSELKMAAPHLGKNP